MFSTPGRFNDSIVTLVGADDNGEEACTLRPLRAVAVNYCTFFGPRAGQKVPTLKRAVPGGGKQPQAAGTAVPSHHPGRRLLTRTAQPCGPGGAQTWVVNGQPAIVGEHRLCGLDLKVD
jgi:hypothetical protein